MVIAQRQVTARDRAPRESYDDVERMKPGVKREAELFWKAGDGEKDPSWVLSQAVEAIPVSPKSLKALLLSVMALC